MYRALILKELRDLRGVLAVAAFVGLLLTLFLAGAPLLPEAIMNDSGAQSVRFTSGSESLWLTLLSLGAALALGYWQSVSEIQRGTALYLFHRPLTRRSIVLVKLAVGLCLQTVIVVLPILVLGVMAGWPGLWAAPFNWGMTWDCWVGGCWSLLVYLGASASGWLDGRWFGMRLAPLATVGPMGLLAVAATYNVWPLLLLLPCAAFLIVTTIQAAEARDY